MFDLLIISCCKVHLCAQRFFHTGLFIGSTQCNITKQLIHSVIYSEEYLFSAYYGRMFRKLI